MGPFDNALAGLCRWGRQPLDMTCISVTPAVFMHHKAKGVVNKDSDIQKYGGNGQVREKGWTENVVWSARNNVRGLLVGGEMESQFPEKEGSGGGQ